MAGSPTCGKISTGIRFNASTAQSATATSATTTVKGRERAANTRRMFRLRANSSARLRYKWLNISRGSGDAEQATPHAEPGQYIINLGLGKQSLGFGHFVDIAETGLIARRRLLGRGAGGRELHRRIGGDPARA